ncbi:MAG: trypsin-like peptidase domain-containing protein [Pseudomonadota bacterium]
MRDSIFGIATLGAAALTMAVPTMDASASMARGAPNGFADLVEDVIPSVVNISTSQSIPETAFSAPTSPEARSLGSGFIVDRRGFVVTNGHVIENADTITVTLEDGEEYKATLKGVDRETDLAVLKIEADRKFPSVSFGNSDRARVGEWVVAIGQPFGLGGSVSVGIISARNRDIDSGLYDDFIQTDAAINRGNSGGPLFDLKGNVIGVNTVIYSQTGGSVGVGFAVPSTLANRVVRQLIEFGQTERGYLGVLLEDVNDDVQSRLSLANKDGAWVFEVPSASGPAALAGIQKDDVIVRFNGRPIKERRDLTRAVADTAVGATVPVIVLRSGERVGLRVTIARRETQFALRDDTMETSGLTLQSSTEETTILFGLPDDTAGVVVTHVEATSPLAGQLQVGDVILEVGWDEVRDVPAIKRQLGQLRHAGSGPVQILVKRDGRLFYAHIRP